MTGISWLKATEHWHEFGYKEKRVYTCDVKPYKCADENYKGEYDKAANMRGNCNCPNGNLHYGMKYMTWHTMFNR